MYPFLKIISLFLFQAEINDFINEVKSENTHTADHVFDVDAIEAFVGQVLTDHKKASGPKPPAGLGMDELFASPFMDSDNDSDSDSTSISSSTLPSSPRSSLPPRGSTDGQTPRSNLSRTPRNNQQRAGYPSLPPLPFSNGAQLPYGGTSPNSARNSARGSVCDSRLMGKVKVFISMHGCPLLKSMLMSCDMDFDQFMQKIEQKLCEPDLRVYYEEDGDKVEIDDDDSVALFFTRRHEGPDIKLKLIAFPAEIVNSRVARAFQTESGSMTSRSFAPTSARGEPRTKGNWQRTMGSLDSYRPSPRGTRF